MSTGSGICKEVQKTAPSLLREFVMFLGESKKWWLLPIFVVVALIGLLVVISSTGAAPFIYSMF
jgi:hypothetical protein